MVTQVIPNFLPLQNKQTNKQTYQQLFLDEMPLRKLEHGGGPHAAGTKTDCIRGVRGMAACGPHHLSPKPGQHHAERSPLSLHHPVRKDSPRQTSRSPSTVHCFLEAPTWGSRSTETAVEFSELSHWESGCDGEGKEELATTSSWILTDQVPTCIAGGSPNQQLCSSAEPIQWCVLTRELGRTLVWLIWVLR